MNGKILLVDDEQEIADLIEVFLQNEQFECYKYYTFQDAFSVIDSECFDLAIINIMLPDGNGFTLCREIRKKYTYPIILLTSKTEGTDKVTGLSLEADDYVTKPFLPIELVARVKAHLRRVHDYEPSIIVFGFLILELFMWIAIERSSSKKILKVLDSLEYVVDNSANNIVLPLEFSDLQNWLNLIKMQNREQQHLLEIEAQKKSDTLTYLAHDIRTPLASVVGYLSLLCEAPDMPVIQREKYTKVAFRKAVQFEKLIDDFFDITRYSLSDKTLVKREIDICFLIEQLADEFYPLLKPKELHIDLKLGEGLFITGDSEKIARVFNNLLKNAINYSYPKSSIEIYASQTLSYITVSIKNYGKTIPADELGHIFDKFYRSKEYGESEESGTGLGLTIAKEIVRIHNGSIYAMSDDEITVFEVKLPIAKKQR